MAKDPNKSKDPREIAGLLDAIPKHNLRELLDERGMSNADLADLLGWERRSAHRIGQWISGKARMTNDNVVRAAHVLDVSPLYLLDIEKAAHTSEFEGRWYALDVIAPRDRRRHISIDVETAHASDEALISHIKVIPRRVDPSGAPIMPRAFFSGESVLFDASGENGEKPIPCEEMRRRLIRELLDIEGDYRDLAQLAMDALGYYLSLCDGMEEAEVFEVVSAISWRIVPARNVLFP